MQITALSFEFLHKKTDAAVRPWAGVQRASCLWSHTGSVFGVLFVGGSRRSLWPNTLLPLRLKWRRLRLFFELQIVFCIHSLPYNPSSILMQAGSFYKVQIMLLSSSNTCMAPQYPQNQAPRPWRGIQGGAVLSFISHYSSSLSPWTSCPSFSDVLCFDGVMHSLPWRLPCSAAQECFLSPSLPGWCPTHLSRPDTMFTFLWNL